MVITRVARRSIQIAFCLVLSLIGVEIALIVLDPYLFRGFYQYDPDLGFRVRGHYPNPDGTVTSQFGFNDRDYPIPPPEGTFRILVVGDSFGWAGGRDGNYTARLERRFAERFGENKVEVINAGYPMTHTGEQLAMLRKYGLQYDPDLVILGFFVGNDFIDADRDRKRVVVNDLYLDISRKRDYSVLGYPLVPRSRLLQFIRQKYRIYAELRRARTEAPSQGGRQGTFSEETFLTIEKARLEFFNTNASRDGRFGPNVTYALESIAEMAALLHARGIEFVVAMYPDEFQVDDDLFKAIVERFGSRPEEFDVDLAQDLLRAFLESKGIRFIDMLGRFRAEGKSRDLYVFRDTHWNDAGNQLAADILFDDLVERVDAKTASR